MNTATAAIVDGDLVINMIIVEVDENNQTDFEIEGCEVVVLPEDSPVTFNWTYADGEFTAPPE